MYLVEMLPRFGHLEACAAIQPELDLSLCFLDNRDVSALANALLSRNTSILEINLHNSAITSVGVRALVEDNVEAMKPSQTFASRVAPSNEGATILADALRRNALPSLKRLHLERLRYRRRRPCGSGLTLEHNTTARS
jgi:hypothetical protein